MLKKASEEEESVDLEVSAMGIQRFSRFPHISGEEVIGDVNLSVFRKCYPSKVINRSKEGRMGLYHRTLPIHLKDVQPPIH